MGRLDGKICVITGAASGIGAETARLFKEEGATVVGVDLSEDGVGDLPLGADVTDPSQVEGMYSRARNERAGREPEVGLLCCRHGIPHLLDGGGGSVINTASFVAVMGAATSQISYTASKGGVLALSRELGVEFARRGVRVNALCPGPVKTPLLQELFAKDPEKARRRLLHLPMGRFAEAREIAQGALFLASDDSSYVTASAFLVDGGLTSAYVTPEWPAS
jgi:NAD(P)-dependent dehydrogenase (short-subunit alcohol dehydrogenase family)